MVSWRYLPWRRLSLRGTRLGKRVPWLTMAVRRLVRPQPFGKRAPQGRRGLCQPERAYAKLRVAISNVLRVSFGASRIRCSSPLHQRLPRRHRRGATGRAARPAAPPPGGCVGSSAMMVSARNR